MTKTLLAPSPWQVLWAAVFGVLLGLSAFGQIAGTTNAFRYVKYTTGMWSLSDPFALAETSNLLTRATALEGTADTLTARLNLVEGYTNAAAEGGSLALTALQPPATNALDVALRLRMDSATNAALAAADAALAAANAASRSYTDLSTNTLANALDAQARGFTSSATNALALAYGPRLSALDAYTNRAATALQPASTNGWEVSSHAQFVTLPAVYGLVNAAVASNPGLTNLVYAVITNRPPGDVTNAYVGIISPYLAISNGVSPAALASWWETVRPFSSSPELEFQEVDSLDGTGPGVISAAAFLGTGRGPLTYTNAVVPPMALGLPVRGLDPQGLFKGATNLLSVSLPDTLAFIGAEAFANCQKLKTVTIPASVTVIGQGAFNSCLALESVYFEGTPPSNSTGFAMFTLANPAARVYTRRGVSAAAFLVSDPDVLTGHYGPETVTAVAVNGVTNFPTAEGVADLGAIESGVSAETVTNIATEVSLGIVALATNGLSAAAQPIGTRFWVSSNGLEFATVEPGPVFAAWRVVSTVDTNVTVLTFSADFAESTAGLKPMHASYTNVWGSEYTEDLWSFSMPSVGGGVFTVAYNHPEESSTWAASSPWTFPVSIPASGIAQGNAYVQYLPITVTNLVSTFVLLQDMTNWLSRADFISASNALAQAVSNAQTAANEAYEAADAAAGIANQAAQDANTALQLINGEGGLGETIDLLEAEVAGKVSVTGGTATNLALAGTVTLTNGTSFFAGVYQSTNGVAFSRNGTNYWILLP